MKLDQRFSSSAITVLTHFYRGEVGRSTDWRRRLDTTTNWAIIAMTATFTFAFRGFDAGIDNHVAFFFTSLIVFLLLCIEARRYRYFDVWRTRARMLEVHLLVPALNPDVDMLEGDWREVLSNDLLVPSFKVSFWEAIAKRLRGNYVWIFIGLLLGWLLRVYTGAPRGGDGVLSIDEFYAACGYGVISPLEMIGAFGAFWAFLIVILATTWKARNVTGEIRRRDRKARQWPI